MASRSDEKKQLRAEREAREAAATAAETRRRRLILLVASVVAAIAVVGVLIAVSQSGSDDEEPGLAGGESITGVQEVSALYRDIPQDGALLGDPDAPATMLEYVDLQCPFCAEYTRNALPTVVGTTSAPASSTSSCGRSRSSGRTRPPPPVAPQPRRSGTACGSSWTSST